MRTSCASLTVRTALVWAWRTMKTTRCSASSAQRDVSTRKCQRDLSPSRMGFNACAFFKSPLTTKRTSKSPDAGSVQSPLSSKSLATCFGISAGNCNCRAGWGPVASVLGTVLLTQIRELRGANCTLNKAAVLKGVRCTSAGVLNCAPSTPQTPFMTSGLFDGCKPCIRSRLSSNTSCDAVLKITQADCPSWSMRYANTPAPAASSRNTVGTPRENTRCC